MAVIFFVSGFCVCGSWGWDCNKILQVCLDSGQNRLSKKISYVYLGDFGRSSGTVCTSGISRAFLKYLDSNLYQKVFTGSEGKSNNLLKNKR